MHCTTLLVRRSFIASDVADALADYQPEEEILEALCDPEIMGFDGPWGRGPCDTCIWMGTYMCGKTSAEPACNANSNNWAWEPEE